MDINIYNDRENNRFVAEDEDGNEVGEILYTVRNAYLDAYHTEVYPEYEGMGVAKAMAFWMFTETKESEEFRIFPRCAFLHRYVKGHPEFASVVVDRMP
jgi:predicted GNAT family acetyltransferase